ncbi:hypothetical protein ACQPYH_07060 [Kribbella sp. CA-245084]|uniref:hypothetical protein n=1 Tax=Kribbella sp. CA-245084 TaxID=3239940 RepID=UPI003D9479A6
MKRTSTLEFSSSMDDLDRGFRWAEQVALRTVRTGDPGAIPSYHAGLLDRPMFYARDVAHQALGAHLLGLDEENFTMLRHFAASATAARRYYPLWAFTFDGRPAAIDYRSDTDFVRETPAPFEIAQKALDLHRWTGDDRYLSDPVLTAYYRHLIEDFIPLHDVQGNGLAGEQETVDIFAGTPTYNEHSGLPAMQIAADGVAAQWAALQAISEGVTDLADRAGTEAAKVLAQFDDSWWDDAARNYVVGLTVTGRIDGLASEASWFPMVKQMPLPADRVHRHLTKLAEWVRKHPPQFLESTSYLPEAFFAHGFDDDALYWIRRLIDSGWEYPEIPFTIVSHLVAGLTGLDIDRDGTVSTRSHLPAGEWVEVRDIPIGAAVLTIRHDGRKHTELTTTPDSAPLRWAASFDDGPPHVVMVAPGATVKLSR